MALLLTLNFFPLRLAPIHQSALREAFKHVLSSADYRLGAPFLLLTLIEWSKMDSNKDSTIEVQRTDATVPPPDRHDLMLFCPNLKLLVPAESIYTCRESFSGTSAVCKEASMKFGPLLTMYAFILALSY